MSFGAVYYLIRDQVICTLTKLSEIKHKLNLIKVCLWTMLYKALRMVYTVYLS